MRLRTILSSFLGFSIFALGCANISAGFQDEKINKEISTIDKSKKDEIWFGILPGERNVIVNEGLDKILKLGDFMEHYPGNWIEKYDSVKITLFQNGKSYSEKGENNILTLKQKNLIRQIGYNSRVKVNVYYLTENSVTHELYAEQINKTYRIVPNQYAEYQYGMDSLMNYLKIKSRNKIDLSKVKPIKVGKDSIDTEGPISIRFTINEKGECKNPKMEVSSMDKTTDELLLKLISEMPAWKPAKNSQGLPIKQEFSLVVTQSSFGWGC